MSVPILSAKFWANEMSSVSIKARKSGMVPSFYATPPCSCDARACFCDGNTCFCDGTAGLSPPWARLSQESQAITPGARIYDIICVGSYLAAVGGPCGRP